jgi:hypothetical protein
MNNNNNNKNKTNFDSVASYIGPGAKGPFYCNHCNRKLERLNQETKEYLCTYCNISYFPDHQDVKRPNKFETPGPETDIYGNVLTPHKRLLSAVSPETWNQPKKDKLPDFFEALKKAGFEFTSFEERVG